MRQLHPVFNVVKLSATLEDPIPGRKLQAPPPPIVVDKKEEWEVEEILDSHWHQRRFQFLVKWKGFSREHNSWEVASDVKAPDLVVEYYQKHPAAPSVTNFIQPYLHQFFIYSHDLNDCGTPLKRPFNRY